MRTAHIPGDDHNEINDIEKWAQICSSIENQPKRYYFQKCFNAKYADEIYFRFILQNKIKAALTPLSLKWISSNINSIFLKMSIWIIVMV